MELFSREPKFWNVKKEEKNDFKKSHRIREPTGTPEQIKKAREIRTHYDKNIQLKCFNGKPEQHLTTIRILYGIAREK